MQFSADVCSFFWKSLLGCVVDVAVDVVAVVVVVVSPVRVYTTFCVGFLCSPCPRDTLSLSVWMCVFMVSRYALVSQPLVFLPHTQCSLDRLRIHHDSDQDKALTESEGMSFCSRAIICFPLLLWILLVPKFSLTCLMHIFKLPIWQISIGNTWIKNVYCRRTLYAYLKWFFRWFDKAHWKNWNGNTIFLQK